MDFKDFKNRGSCIVDKRWGKKCQEKFGHFRSSGGSLIMARSSDVFFWNIFGATNSPEDGTFLVRELRRGLEGGLPLAEHVPHDGNLG